MSGFIVDDAAAMSEAFAGLSDGAARLLMRVSLHASATGMISISGEGMRALRGKTSQAVELVAAEFWVAVPGGWAGLIATARERAGRINGQRSARARAERFGTAQPRSKRDYLPEVRPITSPEVTPFTSTKSPEVNAVTSTGGEPVPPLGSPSLNQGSLSDLSGSSSVLASPKDLSGSARTRTKGPKKPRAERWRRVPAGWQPTAEHVQIAVGLNVDIALEAAKFRDHEFTVAKSDPDATFRNWIRNAKPSARPLGPQVAPARSLREVDDLFNAPSRPRPATNGAPK